MRNVTQVWFGSVRAPSFTFSTSSYAIDVTVPAGAATSTVRLVTPAGSFYSPAPYPIGPHSPAPTLTSFSPTSGSRQSISVTLTGTNFNWVSGVRFNGTPAAGFTVYGPTDVRAVVPATATTGPISITTAGGTATSATSFIVIGHRPGPLAPPTKPDSPTGGFW